MVPFILATNDGNDTDSKETSDETADDRSLLKRLLTCKPCTKITEYQTSKNVCRRNIRFYLIIEQ